jgi:hypothetical protein
MKLNYFIILLLTLLISEDCLSQKSFKKKFDFYEFIVTVNGKEIERKIIGTNCKLKFNEKKGIYNLTFITPSFFNPSLARNGFVNFKIVKNDANGIVVKTIEDVLSSNPLSIIRDSTMTKHKFEFITTIEKDKMVLIHRLFNKND